MRNTITFGMALAAAAIAVPASAATQVTISNAPGSTPGHTTLCNFNSGPSGLLCSNRLPASGGGNIFEVRAVDAPGVGVMGNGTGFLNVQRGTAVLSLAGLNWRNVSFDWGTIDTYNSVILTFASGGSSVFTSSIFPPNIGNVTRRVAFSANDVITSIGFNSTQRSFEVDNIAGSVPEPGTWMLMILGLGAVGFAMRRRHSTSVNLQFA